MESTQTAYGRCPCTGLYQDRYVEVRMTFGGTPKVFGGIPQGACPQCGSRVYKGHTLERLESLFVASKTPVSDTSR